jgi:hypothetical protein
VSRLKIVAGVFVAAALVLPTSSAIALTAKGGGVSATNPYDGDNGVISVYDGSADGDPGKAEYYRQASPDTKRTLWNHSGSGTRVVSGDGSKIIKFQACDENNAAPDDCSGWKAP